MAYLKVIVGPEAGKICELHTPESVLGRHPDCDVAVNVGAASRHHARILLVGEEFFVEDLHSRNGTYLNEQRVCERSKMNEGDRIRISDAVLTFHLGRAVDSRKKPTLIEGQVNLVMVDEAEQEYNLVLVAKCDASSSQATMPSNVTLRAHLKAILEITRNLRRTLALDQVLPHILDSLLTIFPPAERGFIVLKGKDGEVRPQWMKVRQGHPDDTVRISRTIIHQAMEAQEGILSADAIGDERFEASESLPDIRIRSMMCVPLIDADGDSIGAVQIDTISDRGRFRDEDLEVLVGVATQASIAIDNARLHEYTLRERAIQRDLELADQIQRGFLPKAVPELPGYQFFDYYQPASHVGGDFYDYIPLSDGRLAVVVADVVGHGLAAAMLTAKMAAEVRVHLLGTTHPAEAITRLNASFTRDLVEGHFVTLLVAVLAPDTGMVTIVNAGHMRPLLLSGDVPVEDIGDEQVGLPLGIMEESNYRACTIRLSPGEKLMIYTDGINETMNNARQLYGIDRMREQLRTSAGDAHQVCRRLIDDVQRFADGCLPRDDMCLVCFGREK
ncbi:MAG: SpoIIE family protein phosphatase [Planctomycetes bacterium]|nr:SpoIIE family protein phosphatase [Planctomycetota bacterium]